MNYDLDLDLENICRICLTQHEKLVNLFTTQIADGYIRPLPEIVQFCLDITVEKDDVLPKKICETCKTTVINYYTFKERCKRTESVLLQTFHNARKISNLTIKRENDPPHIIIDNLHMNPNSAELLALPDTPMKNEETPPEQQDEIPSLEHHEPLDFTEHVEHMEDDDSIVVDTLIERNEEPKVIEFVVDISAESDVKKQFEYLGSPQSDEIETREEERLIDEGLDDSFDADDNEEYICELCHKCFPKPKYIEHCMDAHFMCTVCYVTFDTPDELEEHRKLKHETARSKKLPSNSLLCTMCNKRWGTSEQLSQHKKLHEALNISMENKFDCLECRKCHTVFLRAEELDSHLTLHDEPKDSQLDDAICTDYQFLEDENPQFQYTCGFCKALYSTMDEMRCHIVIHFDSFSCPFDSCGCEYDTFSRLSLHIIKKHVYAEEHFCTHCRKQCFGTFDELQLHIRNDCTAKTFSCYHCDKKFFSNKALQLHIKHAGDKKYECKHCGKTFAQHGELNIHLRTHTGERPFKCTICSKTYRTASMRAAHMDAHINGKTFQCTVCSKMLQSRTSYRNHMKRHTVGKSYKCSECSKSFYTKYHLDIHNLKIHKKTKKS